MRRSAAILVLLALHSLSLGEAKTSWQTLASGMELRTLTISASEGVAEAKITVLRVDPKLWQMEFRGISQTGETESHTAREWSKRHDFAATINAGMFDKDFKTHLGYLVAGGHQNNKHLNNYRSVVAFDPRDPALPPFRIFDLDADGTTARGIFNQYASAVQNLRLIKRPGTNQWTKQTRKWSEAALGEDEAGRILFIFSRAPFSMQDFNRELLAAGIGVVAAQHLEGGPEAQLYIHVGQTEMELIGSYETAFREDDSNATPWPIPNVLGLRPKAAK
jgi:hypothetical protein